MRLCQISTDTSLGGQGSGLYAEARAPFLEDIVTIILGSTVEKNEFMKAEGQKISPEEQTLSQLATGEGDSIENIAIDPSLPYHTVTRFSRIQVFHHGYCR